VVGGQRWMQRQKIVSCRCSLDQPTHAVSSISVTLVEPEPHL